jgi:hypothetical protein
MEMLTHVRRRALETEDWLRYHPVVRGVVSHYQRWASRASALDAAQALARAICRGCAAARLATSTSAERQIQAEIVRLVRRLEGRRFDWSEFFPDCAGRTIRKAALLKPYLGPREKGVVFIAFESEWVRLLQASDLAEFARRYTLVVSPTGSPHNLVSYVFPAIFGATMFTLIANPRDPEVLPHLAPNLVVVPLYASSWVNPGLFEPVPRPERQYDLIMVANFGKFKRHQALFAALRDMPRDLRLLLIGQDQDGRTAQTIHETARWYGVAERFELRSHQDYGQVARAFCQARASVVLSRREGSCVVVAESLFADTPAALLANAEIGSRVFLNEQTGRLLNDDTLAHDLTALASEADSYAPRAWAEANISCYRSTTILNDFLRQHALAEGQEWTQDIVPMHRTPDPQPARLEDRQRLAPERDLIREQFGLELGRSLEPS